MVSAHERTLERAREAAGAHWINKKFTGAWAPPPDASWPPVYRKEFEAELKRLEEGTSSGE